MKLRPEERDVADHSNSIHGVFFGVLQIFKGVVVLAENNFISDCSLRSSSASDSRVPLSFSYFGLLFIVPFEISL